MGETKIDKDQVDEKVVTDVKNDGTPLKVDSEHINYQSPLSATVDGDGVSVSITDVDGLSGDLADDQTPTTHGNTKHSPAMLENAADKFTAFTEKTSPVGNDILLMEDSADSHNKKKVKMANLLGGGKRSYVFEFKINGWIRTQTDMDVGCVVPFACNVQQITMLRRLAGVSSGSTIVDVNKAASGGAPVTLYTTQGNRPTITQAQGNRKAIIATVPDITALAAGDYISVDVDTVEDGFPLDLTVCVFVEEV